MIDSKDFKDFPQFTFIGNDDIKEWRYYSLYSEMPICIPKYKFKILPYTFFCSLAAYTKWISSPPNNFMSFIHNW